ELIWLFLDGRGLEAYCPNLLKGIFKDARL
ncbi:hypothetical protein EVA_21839, partial [gut metagenome]